MKKASATGTGIMLGALLGYPISYFCQGGAVRAKLSLGDYIKDISEVLHSRDLAPTAIGVWIGCIVVFAIVANLLAGRARGAARE